MPNEFPSVLTTHVVPECTNNSRKTVGISYHRIPKEKGLREAWLARINRFVCLFGAFYTRLLRKNARSCAWLAKNAKAKIRRGAICISAQ